MILISLALCADAVIGNVQEKAMKLHNASNSEMVNSAFSSRQTDAKMVMYLILWNSYN